MASPDSRGGTFNIWLTPLLLLLGGALVVFVFTFLVDTAHEPDPVRVLYLLFEPSPAAAANALSNAGEVAAAVLAIALTVVAIIVELAANRYTHRITELFVTEPINLLVMGFFVVTALLSLWVTLMIDPTGHSGFMPHAGVLVAMVMLALCLLILLPYFGFVFTFINPVNIVGRMRKTTFGIIAEARHELGRRKREVVRGIEQIADVGLNAMEHKDKGVSMASVDALRGIVIDYQDVRHRLEKDWFRVEGELAHNPDFVSMSPAVLDTVSERQIWFEMKVLRQYQTIYNEALNRMRDVNYVIAINTRRMAERAIAIGNDELLALTIKFFNTYLRATINARDVRTAYNVLHQYRLLAEGAIMAGRATTAIEIVRYFKYYGLLSFSTKLPFILETVAYDLCAICELAFDKKSEVLRELLRVFLEVDKESETEAQELSLRGVRKAQVKLATHFLAKGNRELARQVYDDMARERPERLASIRDELLSVRTAEFWEVSDRGVNFDFLPNDQKAKLLEFFEWFGDLIAPRTSQLPDTPSNRPPPMPGDSIAPPPRESGQGLHDVLGAGSDPKHSIG